MRNFWAVPERPLLSLPGRAGSRWLKVFGSFWLSCLGVLLELKLMPLKITAKQQVLSGCNNHWAALCHSGPLPGQIFHLLGDISNQAVIWDFLDSWLYDFACLSLLLFALSFLRNKIIIIIFFKKLWWKLLPESISFGISKKVSEESFFMAI